jgi:hypothetical protein
MLAALAGIAVLAPIVHASPAGDASQPAPAVTPPTTSSVAAPAVVPPPPAPAPITSHPRSRQKTYGLVTAAGGGALLATGVVFGLLARSRWNDAQDVCGGSLTCANDSDTDYAQQFADSARTRAHVSSVLFVAGCIATAAGVYLWVTSPKESAVRVSATATASGAGVVLGGRF